MDRQRPQLQSEDKTIIPDLLSLDSQGNLVIVEFKSGKTPREAIAQLFEYAPWAAIECSASNVLDIAEAYHLDRDGISSKFSDHFRDVFNIPDESEIPKLNQNSLYVY